MKWQKRFLTSFLICHVSLFAIPSGGEVIQGQAHLIPETNSLQIHTNGKAIIHWDQFDIASHEAVRFVQSQAKDAILNRVTKGSASQILGSLQSNCPIYLVNPKGVFIGSSAQIQTAGFIASTADISNEVFCSEGGLLFGQLGDGCIVHLGTIYAESGDVVLIARAIDNQGIIEAPQGHVNLATTELALHSETKQRVFIRLNDLAGNEQGIDNSGTIEALSVEFTTLSPYEKAINHTGSITAFSTLEQNGRIYLVAEEGGTVVDGSLLAKSGEIRILGQTVSLEDKAQIDASGELGGTILIGGDYQGSNATVLNAQSTRVASGAELSVDGWFSDAGKIVIWAESDTQCTAKISAAALGETGNGGFVEISGKKTLTTTSIPNLLSRFGKAGTLLLDPGTITITAGAAGGPNTYGSTFINTALASGNLTLTTATEPGGGAETLTVDNTVTGVDAISWNTANTLSLTGRRNVVIQTGAAINATGTGNLSITGGTIPVAGVVGIAIGTATLQVGGTMTLTGSSTTGGGISLTSTTLQSGGAMNISGTNGIAIVTTAGTQITSTNSSVTVAGTSSNSTGLSMVGTTCQADTSLTVTGTNTAGVNLYGATIQNGQFTTATGTLQITGNTSSNTTTLSGTFVRGLEFTGATASITSTTGDISLTGLGPAGAGGGSGGDHSAFLIGTTTSFTVMTAGS
ncbi:MAG: filamentous hemagglutinin N-terminal domain-containing protein, partial [Chlamydiales bacterium]|nr:filamentous hemagglutinin N-terminal domain-containing protein [Chlamydiales bacterium]